jgi:hypothetical protein
MVYLFCDQAHHLYSAQCPLSYQLFISLMISRPEKGIQRHRHAPRDSRREYASEFPDWLDRDPLPLTALTFAPSAAIHGHNPYFSLA